MMIKSRIDKYVHCTVEFIILNIINIIKIHPFLAFFKIFFKKLRNETDLFQGGQIWKTR